VLKCDVDHENDEKLKELKVKLKQYEETYKINLSKLNVSNDIYIYIYKLIMIVFSKILKKESKLIVLIILKK
jgi:hypothetical protein